MLRPLKSSCFCEASQMAEDEYFAVRGRLPGVEQRASQHWRLRGAFRRLGADHEVDESSANRHGSSRSHSPAAAVLRRREPGSGGRVPVFYKRYSGSARDVSAFVNLRAEVIASHFAKAA